MSNNKTIYILFSVALIAIAGVIHYGLMYERTLDQLEQQENKNELLQEENAMLVDDVFIMSQKLEKEHKEHAE